MGNRERIKDGIRKEMLKGSKPIKTVVVEPQDTKITINEREQAVAAHTHIIPTDHLRRCPVCDEPLFSIRTHTIAWNEVPGMFASPSNLFACGNQDCSVYGLVRVMS